MNVSQRIATITFNRPDTLNAITEEGGLQPITPLLCSNASFRTDYDAFATALRDIDKRDDVLVTIWQGRFVGCLFLVTFK